jgi:hypothetical protein
VKPAAGSDIDYALRASPHFLNPEMGIRTADFRRSRRHD